MIGPNTYHGIRSEFVEGGNNNEDLLVHHALIQAQHAGVALDACTFHTQVLFSFIEGAYCAGVIDNFRGNFRLVNGSPVSQCSPTTWPADLTQSTSFIAWTEFNRPVNDDTVNIFPDDDDDHDVWHFNANLCPTQFVPSYPPGAN